LPSSWSCLTRISIVCGFPHCQHYSQWLRRDFQNDICDCSPNFVADTVDDALLVANLCKAHKIVEVCLLLCVILLDTKWYFVPVIFCQSICPPLFPDNLITLCQVIKLVTLNAMRLCGVALASNFIPVIVYFSNFCSSLQLVHYKNNTVPLCV
jgi:hypothetical protein